MIERLGGDFVQWLRGFYYTAELGGVSAAAQRMGLRQPAVSHQLRALERELGVKLFQRTSKSMLLTSEGRELLEKTIHLFDTLREIKSEVGRAGQETLKGEVALSATHSVAQNQLPSLIETFTGQHPLVRFKITAVAEMSVIVGHVLNADTDMGIVQGHSFSASLHSRPLFTSRLALIALRAAAQKRGWSFGRDEHGCLSSFRELDGVPFIQFSPNTIMGRYIEQEFQRQGIIPSVALTVNTSSLLKKYAEAGLGVTILDELTAAADRDLFDVYPLPDPEARQTYQLLTRLNRYLSPQASAFIRHLLDSEKNAKTWSEAGNMPERGRANEL